jgi:alpha-1,6-mannosyltransferase
MWSGWIWILSLSYILICPFTKVEESFNIQAIHDLLVYGPRNITQYDHFLFPGVVPRSFLGPICVWMFVLPFYELLPALPLLVWQYLSRAVLATFFFIAYNHFCHSIRLNLPHGDQVAGWIHILTAVQFHLLFWVSRPLPNMFALILIMMAYSFWIRSDNKNLVCILSAACIIFRSELVLLAFPILIMELMKGRVRFWALFNSGIKYSLFWIALTVSLDSYFWNRPFMWPEFQVLWFNTVENRSSEWGVSPFHAYWTSLIPRICPIGYLLALPAYWWIKESRKFLIPCGIFVSLYSFLPHKEWRFVIYILPLINLCAAMFIVDALKRYSFKAVRLMLYLSISLSIVLSFFRLGASMRNYPGGVALQLLHHAEHSPNVYIHMDAFTAMTGASRFGEQKRHLGWKYSKNEAHQKDLDYLQANYTHLITSTPQTHPTSHWKVLETVDGFDQLELKSVKTWFSSLLNCLSLSIHCMTQSFPLEFKTRTQLWILKNKR